MRIQHCLEIAAPPERVWRLTTDVEALPAITPTMTEVTRIEAAPLAVGSSVRIKQPAQRSKIWTVTELDAPNRFSWTTRSAGTVMIASHELVATPTGTANTLTVEMRGLMGSVVGALVRRQIYKALVTENEGFRTAAESPGGG